MTVATRLRIGAGSLAPDQLSGLQLWLDGTGLSGLTDGDPVATWADTSGNSRDATQATGGNRPTKQTVGGKTLVRFDGSNDYLTCPAFPAPLAVTTRFAVAQAVVSGLTTGRHIVSSFTDDRQDLYINIDALKTFALYGGDFLLGGATDSRCVLTAVFNGSSSVIALNGVSNTGDAGTNTWGRVCIGSILGISSFFPGDIGEVVVYDRALAAAERRQIEHYLGAKYGVSVA